MTRLFSMITSPSDRENLVFEIWSGSNQLAEVSHEPGKPVEIKIYPPVDGGGGILKSKSLCLFCNKQLKI